MALDTFAFDPATGWNDPTEFPVYAEGEVAVRGMYQKLHDQTRDFINGLVGELNEALPGKQDALTFDDAPTQDSTNPVTSGGVYTALGGKQNTLTFDSSPTQDSTNPVTSGGVHTALGNKQNKLTFDSTPVQGSANPVTSGGIYTALGGKQNTLTFDSAPTQGSANPVTSGGVHTALSGKQNTLTFDSTPTQGSLNPVTSGGIYTALSTLGSKVVMVDYSDYEDDPASAAPIISGAVASADTALFVLINHTSPNIALCLRYAGAKLTATASYGFKYEYVFVSVVDEVEYSLTFTRYSSAQGPSPSWGTLTATSLSGGGGGTPDPGSITTTMLADGAVTTAKIADGAVTSGKLGSGAVATGNIADGVVSTNKLAGSAVTSPKIADANVTTAKIADANVTTAKIADANVTTAKIADGAVTKDKINNAAVTTAKIADANVTTAKIADANVTTAKTNFVKTSLDATKDTEVPTSKAVADYIGGSVEERGAVIPISYTSSTTYSSSSGPWEYVLKRPISLSGLSGIQIDFDVLGLKADGTSDIGDDYNALKLYLVDAVGSAVQVGGILATCDRTGTVVGEPLHETHYIKVNGTGVKLCVGYIRTGNRVWYNTINPSSTFNISDIARIRLARAMNAPLVTGGVIVTVKTMPLTV